MTGQRTRIWATVLAAQMAMALALSAPSAASEWGRFSDGRIVVANRNGRSISVIDVETDTVIGTHLLPNNGEPMYVVYSPRHRRVFVGDRANSRVVVFDARDFDIETTIPTGAGVWHMWADPSLPQECPPENQLWVNNDIDKTITVIDTETLDVITTIPLPQDLVQAGGRPHDVILDPVSRFAYVTVLGLPGPDVVVQYSTASFEEIDRTDVGKDPHLSLASQNHALYVPCQNTHNVFVLDRDSLAPLVPPVGVTGAHGAGMAPNGKTFYTTNFPGNGVDGLVSIDTETNTVVGTTDTGSPAIPNPHNVVLTSNGKKLYVTHSGASADRVTVYRVPKHDPANPVFLRSVRVGLNPFGLAYVP